jgi:hypothetical protein
MLLLEHFYGNSSILGFLLKIHIGAIEYTIEKPQTPVVAIFFLVRSVIPTDCHDDVTTASIILKLKINL